MSNYPNFDDLDKEKHSHQNTENLDNSINLTQVLIIYFYLV